MTDRPVNLIVHIPARLIDPTWSEQDLLDNAAIYIGIIIDDAEKRSIARGEDQAYSLNSHDTTVWTVDGFTEDLNDLAAAIADYTKDFAAGYIVCALWAGFNDDDGRPIEGYGAGDLAPEAVAQVDEDCTAFVKANLVDLWATGQTAEQCGHDFYLTRNHHGAGFWDRGLGDLGERLTQASHPYADQTFALSDDGRIRIE